jgi:hypothetical protein
MKSVILHRCSDPWTESDSRTDRARQSTASPIHPAAGRLISWSRAWGADLPTAAGPAAATQSRECALCRRSMYFSLVTPCYRCFCCYTLSTPWTADGAASQGYDQCIQHIQADTGRHCALLPALLSLAGFLAARPGTSQEAEVLGPQPASRCLAEVLLFRLGQGLQRHHRLRAARPCAGTGHARHGSSRQAGPAKAEAGPARKQAGGRGRSSAGPTMHPRARLHSHTAIACACRCRPRHAPPAPAAPAAAADPAAGPRAAPRYRTISQSVSQEAPCRRTAAHSVRGSGQCARWQPAPQ